jgi:pyridoxamine 5'-phosphate oxidase
MVSPWRPLLAKSLEANSHLPYAKYFQIATIAQDGRPANRTVVFRGFLQDSDTLTAVTDVRQGAK